LRSPSYSAIFVNDGLAPSISPLSSSSFEVYDFGDKTKGSYSKDGITISI